MAIPLSVSSRPLVLDTLSVIGVHHYHGDAPRIYTQARAYFLKDALQVSLAAFERDPTPGSRLALALGGGEGPMLLLALAPGTAALTLCDGAQTPDLWNPEGRTLPAPAAEAIGGVDEQGWYWGARVALPAAVLAQAGVHSGGDAFPMAVLKYRADGPGYGASFAPADPARPLDAACFGRYHAVPY